MTNGSAYLQNANTNAYLETQLAGKAPAGYGLGDPAADISNQNLITATSGKSGLYRGVNVAHAPDSDWWRFIVNAGISNSIILALDNYGDVCYLAKVDHSATSVTWNKVYTANSKPTAAEVGAAPKGLSSAYVTASTEDEITARMSEVYGSMIDNTAKIFNLSITSGGLTLDGGGWFVTIYRTTSQYGYAEAVNYGGSGGKKFTRAMYGGSWGGWKNASPSAFAPAKLVDNFYTATGTEEDLLGIINSVYSSMPDRSVRYIMISFKDFHPTLGGSSYIFRLWRCYGDYGTLEATSYSGGSLRRNRVANTWQPWEWENPPMIPGVEYRTTERRNGEVVYKKTIPLGKLPASTTKFENLVIADEVVDFSFTTTDNATEKFIHNNKVTALGRAYTSQYIYVTIESNAVLSQYYGDLTISYTKL